MITVEHDLTSLGKAFYPGIASIVFQAFESRLEEKLEGIVQEVYKELAKELPSRLDLHLKDALCDKDGEGRPINFILKLYNNNKEETT